MIFKKLALEGLLLIQPKVFEDNRGVFFESFNDTKFRTAGDAEIRKQLDPVVFVQDNIAFNWKKNTIRGLHFQDRNPQAKFVTCLEGEILDVAVDIRPGSPTHGKWVSVILDDRKCEQLFIPKGFAHGYRSLVDNCVVMYKADAYYDPSGYRGLHWNDPDLKIDWGLGPGDLEIIVSDQDSKWGGISELDHNSGIS